MDSSGQNLINRRSLLRRRSTHWLAGPETLVLLIVLAIPVLGQDGSSTGEVRRILDAQVAAWNRGDIDDYMKGYWNSDSTVFVSGGTMTKGYHKVLARYKKSYDTPEKMGKLEFRELTIRLISSNAALATGVWELTRSADKPWGRFSLVVEKKPEGWRITHDHTSSAQ